MLVVERYLLQACIDRLEQQSASGPDLVQFVDKMLFYRYSNQQYQRIRLGVQVVQGKLLPTYFQSLIEENTLVSLSADENIVRKIRVRFRCALVGAFPMVTTSICINRNNNQPLAIIKQSNRFTN